MNSCLYPCRVMHRRLAPKPHFFEYAVFMFYLDLSELDRVAEEIFWVSRNGRNVFSFMDSDHVKSSSLPLREKIQNFVRENGIDAEGAKIMLLTNLRIFGYVFNPVSFYFFFDSRDKPLCAVTEVSNTFHEMKLYFVPCKGGLFSLRAPKHFYVSPFMDLDLEFDFELRSPGEGLEIYIDDFKGEERVLTSSLKGARKPLTNARLFWYTLSYPFLTLKIIFLIHWNALLLYAKKVPHHKKESNPDLQRGILNPRRAG